MDSRLYVAGYLAIPLKVNTGHTLNPQPNFLVIENIFGNTRAEIPTLGDVVVANSFYKIVHREILLANEELGRAEEMREIIYESANQYVPILIAPALSDYEYLMQAIPQVNEMLSLFQFRGILAGFQLIIDEDAMSEIIVSTTTLPITTTTENITTTVENITTSLQLITTTQPI